MAKRKKSSTIGPPSMNQRINNVLDLGPMAALYIVAGIDMLKAHIDSLDDEALEKMFEHFFSAGRVRSNINQIHKIINNLPDE